MIRCLLKHRWSKIYFKDNVLFLNNSILDDIQTNFRICNNCSVIHQYNYDSQGGYWTKLDDKKSNIVKKKLIENEYFIKEKFETNNETTISRLEIITENGREFVDNDSIYELSFQDDNKTLKLFKKVN